MGADDGTPRWARPLQARSRPIGWAIGGFLLGGVLTEYLTAGHGADLIGPACAAGAAWGYRLAGRTRRPPLTAPGLPAPRTGHSRDKGHG